MSTGQAVALLDEALRVGAQELDALVAGEVDLATELCDKRADLMARGWALRDEDLGELRSRLFALRDLQERLSEEGGTLKQRIQARLNQSKKEMQRIRGYGQAVSQALN